jgi:perosamine synthetase
MLRFSTFGPDIGIEDMKYLKKAMIQKNWYNDPYHYCEKFQQDFSKYLGVKYSLLTSNCTSAIHLILESLNLKSSDEIIAPNSTWIASVSPVFQTKAKLVLCDVNKENWCIDLNEVKKNINNNTKVIISVNLFGNLPPYLELKKICKKNKIFLLEDAAEALGTVYKNKKAGTFGNAAVFSFHRTKTITSGEGGVIVTNNKKLFEKCYMLRDHGRDKQTKDLFNKKFAFKYMPSNIQAALLCSQLEKVNQLVEKKRKIFFFYKKYLNNDKFNFNTNNNKLKNGCWATVLNIKNISKKKINSIFKNLILNGYFARPFFYPISSLPAFKEKNIRARVKYVGNKNSLYLLKTSIVLPSAYLLKEKNIKKICSIINNEIKI